MKIPTKSDLTAVVYGMDKRSYETLRMSFNGPGKGYCSLTSNEDIADLAIINMDHIHADEFLQEIRAKYPQRHTIVLSVNDPLIEDTQFVARPIRMDEMIKTIKIIQQLPPLSAKPPTTTNTDNENMVVTEIPTVEVSTPAPATGKAQAQKNRVSIAKLDFNQPEHKETYFFDPKSHLQGLMTDAIKQASKKSVAAQISIKVGKEWKTITILPESKRILTSISNTWLEQLCTTPVYVLEVKTRYHNKKNSLDLEFRASEKEAGVSLDNFLWRVAIWTSQGRVPLTTDLKSPIFLKRWPNITRLSIVPPNAMRIITLLIDQPRELPLISQVLGIPYSDVFTLYSALNAIGLAGCSVRNMDTLIQPKEPKQHRLHGLFGKILNKLGGSK